jgi:hypothetical protein
MNSNGGHDTEINFRTIIMAEIKCPTPQKLAELNEFVTSNHIRPVQGLFVWVDEGNPPYFSGAVSQQSSQLLKGWVDDQKKNGQVAAEEVAA